MEELYKEYSKLVYNYLYSLCRNKDTAEELTQETFYRAIKGVDNFKGNSKVTTWLCQIAKNIWIDYLRHEKQANLVPFDDDTENLILEKMIESETEDRDEIIELYKQIHKLDEKTKEVCLLRIKGELSFKEIGEVLGRTEEWARITFYRGKIGLKEGFKDE